ncbi:MAG: translation initiation factor IF-2 N-terminal domain-containing protein, partial [Clostridia bacterium]|nr:translation initiation factor IF-2 N-terminal domain-containing protein [Clostridia bacterium]
MSKKTRISELAQEINSSNKRVIELLDKIGIKVSNASSSLTEEQVEQFYESINFKRADKTEGDAPEQSARTQQTAAEPARKVQQQTSTGTVNPIKDPRQAQPVIRKIVVHNSGKTETQSGGKQAGGNSQQAPTGLRQGLALQKGEDNAAENKEAAPEQKSSGVVRRIVRNPAPQTAQPASARTVPSATTAPVPAENKDAAQADNGSAEAKTVVRRVKRVEKTETKAASGEGTAPSESTPEKAAPEKAAENEAAPATAAASESAPVSAAEAPAADEKEEKAAAEAKEPSANTAPAETSAAPATKSAAPVEGSREAKKEKETKVRTESTPKAKESVPSDNAPRQAQPSQTASGTDAKTAPARRGPVYISRARDSA